MKLSRNAIIGGLLVTLGLAAFAGIIIPLSPTFDQVMIGTAPYSTKIKDGVNVEIKSGESGFAKKFIKLLRDANVSPDYTSASNIHYKLNGLFVRGDSLDTFNQKVYTVEWLMRPTEEVYHYDSANVYDSYKRIRFVNFSGEATNEVIKLLIKAGVTDPSPKPGTTLYDARQVYGVRCLDAGTLTGHIHSHCTFYLSE